MLKIYSCLKFTIDFAKIKAIINQTATNDWITHSDDWYWLTDFVWFTVRKTHYWAANVIFDSFQSTAKKYSRIFFSVVHSSMVFFRNSALMQHFLVLQHYCSKYSTGPPLVDRPTLYSYELVTDIQHTQTTSSLRLCLKNGKLVTCNKIVFQQKRKSTV